MNIVDFTPVSAFVGGCLIGAGALLILLLNGKIAGISGMVARLFRRAPGDTGWRIVFLVGMIAGGTATFVLYPPAATFRLHVGWPILLIAGFLVGLGTRVGEGCTSGHGVCGVSRGSLRSMAATGTFMAAGFVTVYFVRHVFEGGAA